MITSDLEEIARTWVADRRLTGTTYGRFLLEDALPAVGRDREMAHLVCEMATELWRSIITAVQDV